MGVFEYIGVLISVVMGLGITHLATGATKLIQNRETVTFYWPHAVWTINVLVYILMIWWGLYWWSSHEEWFVYEYLFITFYSIVLFFLASMLYPWNMRDDIDVREYFLKNKSWFFAAMLFAWIIDVPETLVKAQTDLRPVPQEYFLFVGLHWTIAITGLVTRNRVVHQLLPIAWFVLTIYYATMSLIGRIGT